VRSLDDALETEKCFHIDLVLTEEFRVVAEVPKKPAEFPQGLFGGIQSSDEGFLFEGLRFHNHKAEFEKRFSRLPAEKRAIDTNQKTAFQKVVVIGLPGMQARNLSSHWLTS